MEATFGHLTSNKMVKTRTKNNQQNQNIFHNDI